MFMDRDNVLLPKHNKECGKYSLILTSRMFTFTHTILLNKIKMTAKCMEIVSLAAKSQDKSPVDNRLAVGADRQSYRPVGIEC